jgi:hypothetical protein
MLPHTDTQEGLWSGGDCQYKGYVCMFRNARISNNVGRRKNVRLERGDAHADGKGVHDDVRNLHEDEHVPLGELFGEADATKQRLAGNDAASVRK